MSSRITNNMMVRNYRNSLRTNLGNLSSSNSRLSTQRTFNKASENVTGASRALRIRKMLADNERYCDNIETLSNRYDTADAAMRSLSGVYQRMNDLVTRGLNGVYNEHDRAVMANEVEKLRDEALSLANIKYGDQYVFNSAGNETGAPPFSVDENGKLCYNGNTTPIDQLVPNANGKAAVNDGNGNLTAIDYDGVNYLDVGLGLSENSSGAYNFDTKSVVQASISGIDMFGYGVGDTGMPNNFYGLFSDISDALTSGNMDVLGTALTALEDSHNHILMSLSDLGNQYNFLEDMSTQANDNKISLQQLQNDIEAVNLSEEIMYNSQFEMAWTVSLQIGSSLLPQSIFDFLR